MNRPRVAIIDHSYHEKTKSTEFLFDLFREYFEVDVFFDDSWKRRKDRFSLGGMPLREDYEWIVFLQVFPPPGIFRFLKCKKILCVPMLDGMVGLPPEFFSRFRCCFFLSFSRTLHEFLTELGHRSFYLQYFPEVVSSGEGTVSSSGNDSAFFWQRRSPVTSEVVKALLGESPAVSRLHIHRKADPGFEELDEASVEFPSTLEVTTSAWLETREEFHHLMARSGIFFAPREYEGIGMSFLEAMGMGKCVVSPDLPTANEYIEHGVNGLLYNPANPEVLDLREVAVIRREAARFSSDGREVYLRRASQFVSRLAIGDISMFGGYHLAVGSEVANPSLLRRNESLELIRERTASPWIFRTARKFLIECLCFVGFVWTRFSTRRKPRT